MKEKKSEVGLEAKLYGWQPMPDLVENSRG